MMPATAPAAPRQPQQEKKSLCDIYERFAAEAVARFPHMKGRLLIMDMNEFTAYGTEDIDRKATHLTKETAFDYLSEHPVTDEMETDKNATSCSLHDKNRHLNIIFINDRIDRAELNEVTAETEAFILYSLNHELAHLAIKDSGFETGSLRETIIKESIADAYAMLCHYQRSGVDSLYHDKFTDPCARANQLIFHGGKTHFTAFVLDEIMKRRHDIDFDKLAPQQIALLARRFALEYASPAETINELYQTFKPVRIAPKPRIEEGVKALISITLDPESDYHTFKLGKLWLERFLETRTLPNGKQTALSSEYLDDAAKKLKEREFQFAREDILFNIPKVERKPQLPRFAA